MAMNMTLLRVTLNDDDGFIGVADVPGVKTAPPTDGGRGVGRLGDLVWVGSRRWW